MGFQWELNTPWSLCLFGFEQIEPAARGLCRQLPALRDSQQRLAANLPQFKPYATLEADDIADCERDVRSEFASL